MTINPPGDPYQPFPSFTDFVATAAFDPMTFDAFVSRFEELKTSAGEEILTRSVDTATRWAAVNTNAIEGLYDVDRGFTYTVAASAAALDDAHKVIRGENVQDKINDAMAGYEFVLDVATGGVELTEHWIKELHATICASQETYDVYVPERGFEPRPLLKGQYKTDPNSPMRPGTGKIHNYASPLETPAEMARLAEELGSDRFREAHPVLQAAYSHYAFVCVHPFADGNGRVSRALASAFLYRRPGIPLVVFADQKGAYFDVLAVADGGDVSRFVDFVLARALDIIGMVSEDMSRPVRPKPQDRLQHLKDALIAPQGLSHEEMDAVAVRLTSEWLSALKDAVKAVGVEAPMQLSAARKAERVEREIEGYRSARTNSVVLSGNVSGPAGTQREVGWVVRIPNAGTATVDFTLLTRAGESVATFVLREIHPQATTALQYRLQVLAEGFVEESVDELVTAAERELKKRGFTA